MNYVQERRAQTHTRNYDASTVTFESKPHIPRDVYRRTSLDQVPLRRATFFLPAPADPRDVNADEDMYDWMVSLHARGAFQGKTADFDTWRTQLSWITRPLQKLVYGNDMERYLTDEINMDGPYRGDFQRRLMELRDAIASQIQRYLNKRYDVATHCVRRGRPYNEETIQKLSSRNTR